MNIRVLTEEDYGTIMEWWTRWEWPVLPRHMLPDNGKSGYMVEKDDKLIVCGFLYLTNSKIAWLEWIVSNPDYREKDRKQAIELLIKGAENVCKNQGIRYIFSIGRSQHLINTHKQLGYTVDEKPSYEITKII